jgi:hypothetical protein
VSITHVRTRCRREARVTFAALTLATSTGCASSTPLPKNEPHDVLPSVEYKPIANAPRQPTAPRKDRRVEVYFRIARTPRPVDEVGTIESRIGWLSSRDPEDAFVDMIGAAADHGCDALVRVDVIAQPQAGEVQSSPRTNVRIHLEGNTLFTVDGYRGVCAVYR